MDKLPAYVHNERALERFSLGGLGDDEAHDQRLFERSRGGGEGVILEGWIRTRAIPRPVSRSSRSTTALASIRSRRWLPATLANYQSRSFT